MSSPARVYDKPVYSNGQSVGLEKRKSPVGWLVKDVPQWWQVAPWKWATWRKLHIATGQFILKWDVEGAYGLSELERELEIQQVLKLHRELYA